MDKSHECRQSRNKVLAIHTCKYSSHAMEFMLLKAKENRLRHLCVKDNVFLKAGLSLEKTSPSLLAFEYVKKIVNT